MFIEMAYIRVFNQHSITGVCILITEREVHVKLIHVSLDKH